MYIIITCCSGGTDTPLTLAIVHKHPIVGLTRLRRGANILLADTQEQTALCHAAKQNLYAVDVNAYDKSGVTPLMQADTPGT
jgi:hypothetical protein